MAHCGDCRCVIGLEHTGGLVFATQDHKPDVMSEQERIDAAGGEVRSQIYPDGWVVHRVFARGQELPGLCKSRSLGDLLAKEVGVTAVPDVAVVEVKLARKPFILLASDGIWEFLDSEFVVKAIAKILATDGPSRTARLLDPAWCERKRGHYKSFSAKHENAGDRKRAKHAMILPPS
ncbi:unnamed protein product [Effrenium voratum]|nr:unnamed protein product [Effrenium voratum]